MKPIHFKSFDLEDIVNEEGEISGPRYFYTHIDARSASLEKLARILKKFQKNLGYIAIATMGYARVAGRITSFATIRTYYPDNAHAVPQVLSQTLLQLLSLYRPSSSRSSFRS